MISENNYIIPQCAKEDYATQNAFLLIATDLETEEKPMGQDAIISGIKNVEVKLRTRLNEISS